MSMPSPAPRNKKQKSIFLSHSSKDKALADKVADLLTSGCAVNPNEILCTTLEGKGIPAGTPSFIEYLRQQIQEPKLVILLLSENFFASQFCLCELGAVWGMGLTNFPLVVPPMDKGKLRATLAVAQAGDVDSATYLDELRDVIQQKIGTSVPTPTWNVKRDAFLGGLGGVLASLQSPTPGTARISNTAPGEDQDARTEIAQNKELIAELQSELEQLRRCQDGEQIKKVRRRHSSAEEEINLLCEQARRKLSVLLIITRVVLYWKLQGQNHYTPANEEEWKEARHAQLEGELEISTDRKSISINRRHAEIRLAEQALWEISWYLSSLKGSGFAREFKKANKLTPALRNKDFWKRMLLVSMD